ncbi:MAG: 3-hydroxyacyl-ACP dehydratase [Candidatus Delongbacteria bacterium]|nr:3-hydroxyacyl-ACP dehydratase [Candidatus Delongbacteria bacterium]
MITAGIDLGSRTIKIVLIQDRKIIYSDVQENSFNSITQCKKMLEGLHYDKITSTGYGRHLFAEHFPQAEVMSEIKAFALGINYLFPECRTILDIGGQDTKAISLDHNGRILNFEMNDKCAAGTGRFLEIMATALRYDLGEFGEKALMTDEIVNISSMCTVFAESEVVSMAAKGYERKKIARGIHNSIAKRSVSLLNKVGINGELAFVGGVAKNSAMKPLLEKLLGKTIVTYHNPQIVGAIGCALENRS